MAAADPTRRFDHGELNIPGRLKGLDAEIDRNLRRIAAERRAAETSSAENYRAKKTEALALVAKLNSERLAELGRPHNLTVAQCRSQMQSLARSRPEQVIRTLSRELAA